MTPTALNTLLDTPLNPPDMSEVDVPGWGRQDVVIPVPNAESLTAVRSSWEIRLSPSSEPPLTSA